MVSGRVTDYVTGSPVVGAEIIPLGEGKNWGPSYTDDFGRFERQLPPGKYYLELSAVGYYDQEVGGTLAYSGDHEVMVRSGRENAFDQQMVPNTVPFVGIGKHEAGWTVDDTQYFDDLALFLNYSAYAAVPDSWPRDTLLIAIKDHHGRTLLRKREVVSDGGGGASSFSAGSTDGCGFLEHYPKIAATADMQSLTITARLASKPTVRAEEPFVIDSSVCRRTKIDWYVNSVRPTHEEASVSIGILNRLSGDQAVPGRLTVSARKRATSVRIGRGQTWVTLNVGPLLRRGRNRLTLRFEPGSSGLEPAVRHVLLKVRPPR